VGNCGVAGRVVYGGLYGGLEIKCVGKFVFVRCVVCGRLYSGLEIECVGKCGVVGCVVFGGLYGGLCCLWWDTEMELLHKFGGLIF
jgi:hypothetical protein